MSMHEHYMDEQLKNANVDLDDLGRRIEQRFDPHQLKLAVESIIMGKVDYFIQSQTNILMINELNAMIKERLAQVITDEQVGKMIVDQMRKYIYSSNFEHFVHRKVACITERNLFSDKEEEFE